MAARPRLAAPQPKKSDWPWHEAEWSGVPVSLFTGGDRRMEAENYLSEGFQLKLVFNKRQHGWTPLGELAEVWQPNRLKGIVVGPEHGNPFLTATQVLDHRPFPRKWLALERTHQSSERFVQQGQILVTCSGNVGRATIAPKHLEGILISHDILRVSPKTDQSWGWIYASLRAPMTRLIMTSAQYGHIIKHLEAHHLDSIPIVDVDDQVLEDFHAQARIVLDWRNEADNLITQAEEIFERKIGFAPTEDNAQTGFSVSASETMFCGRRRLEAGYHTPEVTDIIKHFFNAKLSVDSLKSVTVRVWWMSRFKRVFGDTGAPYYSGNDLFSVNPPITKRVLLEQADNPEDYFAKEGWIVMACSGQTYGLNGSVILMTKTDEECFLTHDLIRIIPDEDLIRTGYLLIALGHPRLGRPLVIRNAYGSSIPHLDPMDVAQIPIVRLGESVEEEIADLTEQAASLRSQADVLENQLADEADWIINQFIGNHI